MCFTPALKRNLFFLLGLVISLALHSAPAAPSAPLATVPVTATALLPKKHHTGSLFSFKQLKQAVKQYVVLAKSVKKRYRNDALGSTILLALLMALGLGALIYLLSYASVSGIVITAAAIVGFGLIVVWAWRRIRWNAEY